MNPDPISALKEQAAGALVPLVERWSRGDAAALIGIERERIAELCRVETRERRARQRARRTPSDAAVTAVR